MAIYYGRVEIINSILEINSSVQFITARDKNGETALHTATLKDDVMTCMKLLNRGASFVLKNNVDQNDKDGTRSYRTDS